MFVLVPKAPSTPTPDNRLDQSSSPLFALPAELRNLIWSYLLIQPSFYTDESGIDNPPTIRPQQTHRFCANILQTCKQAHAEGSPILYGENVFHAHSSLLTALPAFLVGTRPLRLTLPPVTHPRPARLIRRYYIHVRLDVDARYSMAQVTEAFSGADELSIDVSQAMYGSCSFDVLALFEGVRGVRKAQVRGSTGDGKYARWLAGVMELPLGTDPEGFCEEHVARSNGRDAWSSGNR
ncbi:Hypothetical protein R9X50_00266900 [Acrodontium crateriforme]|uniref:Uncharacterized protein n=1 Tax=Acrodontium crateriforme TaxID=150365 RepID=A0AAQ3R979_9PEZI|nr:Hypothetical protein R9X50_00266900 [Acrodontium crateriforme]